MTHRRIAAAAAVAYLAASVAYAVPSVQVEVKYPDTVAAAALERRLAVEVSSVSQLAFQASSPSIAVQATVAGYTADYGIDAAYSRAVARADVQYPRPHRLAAQLELDTAAEGWVEASALPHIARLSAEAVQTGADLAYLIPTVALIETSLGFTLDFADFVVVLDDLQNVRDLTILEGPFVDDRLTVAYSAERADSAPALDTVAVGTFKEFADAVGTSDLLGFGFFITLGIGDWTSPWNGMSFNEYPLHDSNRATIVAVTDHTRLTGFGKVFLETVTPSDQLQPFFIGKALSDASAALEAHVVDFVMAPLSDSVTASESFVIGFDFTYPIAETFTSPWNGAAFNVWPFNEQNMGDALMPSDVILLHPQKVVADSVAPSELLTPFVVAKVLADSQALVEAHVVALTKPLADSQTVSDAIDYIIVGKALADSVTTSEALVKYITPAGFTDAASASDAALEIEHIVPAQVIFNSGPFNEVPFN